MMKHPHPHGRVERRARQAARQGDRGRPAPGSSPWRLGAVPHGGLRREHAASGPAPQRRGGSGGRAMRAHRTRGSRRAALVGGVLVGAGLAGGGGAGAAPLPPRGGGVDEGGGGGGGAGENRAPAVWGNH